GRSMPSSYVDFRPGALQHTGAPLDLAIDGNDFFTLQGPDGPLYTRNGTFRLNPQGQIVSQGGYPLQGTGGPITIPSGAADITVARDGGVSAGGQPIGRIQLARFQDLSQLATVIDGGLMSCTHREVGSHDQGPAHQCDRPERPATGRGQHV